MFNLKKARSRAEVFGLINFNGHNNLFFQICGQRFRAIIALLFNFLHHRAGFILFSAEPQSNIGTSNVSNVDNGSGGLFRSLKRVFSSKKKGKPQDQALQAQQQLDLSIDNDTDSDSENEDETNYPIVKQGKLLKLDKYSGTIQFFSSPDTMCSNSR